MFWNITRISIQYVTSQELPKVNVYFSCYSINFLIFNFGKYYQTQYLVVSAHKSKKISSWTICYLAISRVQGAIIRIMWHFLASKVASHRKASPFFSSTLICHEVFEALKKADVKFQLFWLSSLWKRQIPFSCFVCHIWEEHLDFIYSV